MSLLKNLEGVCKTLVRFCGTLGKRKNAQAALIGVGRLLEAALNLVLVRLYTSLLSQVEVGRLALLLALIGFIPNLIQAPAGSFILRQTIEWNTEGRLWRELCRYQLLLILLLPGAAICFTLLGFISSDIRSFQILPLLFIGGATLVATGAQQNFSGVLNILGRRSDYVIVSNLALAVGIGLAVVFVHNAATAEAWQSGIVIGYTLLLPISLYLIYRIRIRVPPSVRLSIIPTAGFVSRGALTYALPLALVSICFWVQTLGYRTLLVSKTDAVNLGIFAVSLALGTQPVVLITKIANDYFLPRFYRQIAHADETTKIRAWRPFVLHYLGLGLITSPVIAAAAHFYCRILVAPAYWGYAWIAWIGVAFQLLSMAYSAYVILGQSMMDNKVVLWANIWSSVVILLGIYFLAGRMPLLGPGIAMIAGSATLLFAAACTLHRRYKPHLPWKPLFHAAGLGTTSSMAILLWAYLVPSPSLLYSFFALGCIGFILLASIFVFMRKYPPSLAAA